MLRRLLPILLALLALPAAAQADPTATSSIVGGQPAAAQSWPSIAFLIAFWDDDGDGTPDGASSCTGTVVAPEWIVTAAHCAFRDGGQPIDALLTMTGTNDSSSPDNGETIAADRLVIHPSWNAQTLMGDAMLVHLEARSSRPAMPVARADGAYVARPDVPNAAGWGLIDEDATMSTDILQAAYLEILEDAECKGWDPTFDAATQTCAFSAEVSGACRGDSGGPLTMLDQAGTPHLWGITSYGTQLGHGMKPCDLSAPAVFTWAPAFAGWIATTTGTNQPVPPPGSPGPVTPTPPIPVPPPSAPADTTAPVLSAAKLGAKKLRAAGRGATIAARRTGTTLSFRLSEAAAVRVTVLKGRRALSPSALIAANAGKTTKKFSGRIGGKRLKPGAYRLQLTAVDAAGNAGKRVRLPFRIVR